MNAIFASKMYKYSKNKDKVKAALDNPVNGELIKQLGEYLGEEYQQLNQSAKTEDEPIVQDVDNDSEESDSNVVHNNNSHSFTPPSHGSVSPHNDMKLDSEFENVDNEESEESHNEDENLDEILDVESSTEVNKSPIMSTTDPNNVVVIDNISTELLGLLNSRVDTSGVIRVAVKADEVWVYYSDDINLNNLMTNVITLLQASNYYFLDFNRLARTDNAIVFTISMNDTKEVSE